MPSVAALVVGAVIAIALIWSGIALYGALSSKSSGNYAEDVAKPLEDALVKAGGVKKCSRGDAGRGSDNDKPNYKALYEIPHNRSDAAKLISTIAQDNGFILSDNSANVNGGDNKDYIDRTSKHNPYSNLDSGYITLHATVYGSSTYTSADTQFCTVTKSENPPTDKTTIDITVNLPAFKH